MLSVLLNACKKVSVTYKTVSNHDILADVFVPEASGGKNVKKRPLIVRFHGGGMVTGAREYNKWVSPWLVDFAVKHGAIVVMPDYRLLPEANGSEILEDVDDFWDWAKMKLVGVVESLDMSVQVDFDKVLAVGESAGGYLSIQSGLSQPSFIKAVVAMYPMLDWKAPFFTQSYEKPLFGGPQLPASIITSHLANMPKDSVVSYATPPERMDLATAFIQHGRYLEFLTPGGTVTDTRIFPVEHIQESENPELPPTFICHAKDDAVVPIEGSRKFTELARDKGLTVRLAEASGGHGFDNAIPKDELPEWFLAELEFVRRAWLGE